jgi:RHS repeat-associated protein
VTGKRFGDCSARKTFQNLAYDYDNVGNVTSIGDTIFTADRTFTYDKLNRLRTASGDFGALVGGIPGAASCTYTYNAIGNMTNKCGIVYSYNDPLHPSFVTSTSDGKTYIADANGNTASGAGRTFSWTPDNRVASVTMGSTTFMDYDYTGIRVKKTSGSAVTIYPFGGYEIGPDGVISKFFKVGNEILAAKKSTGEKLFYHNDHLGGVNVITNISGTRVQLTEYDPWGKVSRSEGNADPSHRFTGQELDPESGLYYYGGRYYDAPLGRFVSPDIFVPEPKNPQSLNRYTYTLNNPVMYVDPDGHFAFFFGALFFASLLELEVNAVIAGAISFASGAAIQTAILGGNNYWQSVLMGGISGAVGGAFIPGGPLAYGGFLFNALGGGVIGAPGVAAISGVVIGGLNTAISGGSFWKNAGIAAVTAAFMAAIASGGYESEVILSGPGEKVVNSNNPLAPDPDGFENIGGHKPWQMFDPDKGGGGSGRALLGGPPRGGSTRDLAPSSGLTVEEALRVGPKWLGPGSREVVPGSGVFRSADGLRQFRFTTGDILGTHGKLGPHVHFEYFSSPFARTPIINYHIPLR